MSAPNLAPAADARGVRGILSVSSLRHILSFERRTLTEIATGLSIVAIAGSTLYNLGFFAPIEWSLISVLSVQDLLVGASMAVLPMSVAMWLAGLGARHIAGSQRRPRQTLMVGVPLLLSGTAAALYFMYGPQPSTIAHLGFAYVATGAAAAIVNIRIGARLAGEAWLVFSLLYIPFSVGVGDSLGAMSTPLPESEIVSGGTTVTGRILRLTSGYAMMFEGPSVVVMPLTRVERMRRLFDASPERDYLVRFGR
jgi:hypothetical protein